MSSRSLIYDFYTADDEKWECCRRYDTVEEGLFCKLVTVSADEVLATKPFLPTNLRPWHVKVNVMPFCARS